MDTERKKIFNLFTKKSNSKEDEFKETEDKPKRNEKDYIKQSNLSVIKQNEENLLQNLSVKVEDSYPIEWKNKSSIFM